MIDKFDLSQVIEKEWLKGFKGRAVHGNRATVIFWKVAAGAVLPSHSHPHEQITTVLRGNFTITLNGQDLTLLDGQGVVIPPDTPHGGTANSDTEIIDIFSPVREDYK